MIPLVAVVASALQEARPLDSPWDMVIRATPATKIVLLVLLAFSLLSWILIFWKWVEFRRVREEGDDFVREMESSAGLADVYAGLRGLAESPYTRVFRHGVNFFTELRPRALQDPVDPTEGLSSTQLDTRGRGLE